MFRGWDPKTTFPSEWFILLTQISTGLRRSLLRFANTELRLDTRSIQSPIRQSILTIDDNLFRNIIRIISRSRFTWRNRRIINQIEKMFSISGDESEFL